MIGTLLRMAVRMLILAGLLYVAFFVPVGKRTLYAHLSRIAATPEAQELLGAVSGLVRHAKDAVASRL